MFSISLNQKIRNDISGYVAIRSHLEAMEIFNKWNKLSQSRENYNDSNTIDMSASFVRVISNYELN